MGWHEQLEHVQSAACVQALRQLLQAGSLPSVEGIIASGIVAHEHFAKGWIKLLDVAGEV
jgi:hypothetical protein